jgi:uncharacterized peroxidase-related enzyme
VSATVYVSTVDPADATGAVRDMYDADLKTDGYVATDTRLFSLQPEVYAAWIALSRSIRKSMRLRRYELITVAAARALGCRACVSGHSALLIRQGLVTREQMAAIVRDFRRAGLDPVEVALMELGEKVALDAHAVTAGDVEALRAMGLQDDEIFGAVLAAAARAFYSKSLEAMGTPANPELAETNCLLDLARPVSAMCA